MILSKGQRQLERKAEEGRTGPNRNLNEGDCCKPAANFRALKLVLCRKILLKAYVWRWGIDRLRKFFGASNVKAWQVCAGGMPRIAAFGGTASRLHRERETWKSMYKSKRPRSYRQSKSKWRGA